MNTKIIANKIIYHNLNNKGVFELVKIAYDNDLFSDIEFLEFFKNKDDTYWFWSNAIMLTKIPIKKIVKKYREYIFTKTIYDVLFETAIKYWLYDNDTKDKETINTIKNIREYLDEYEKNC